MKGKTAFRKKTETNTTSIKVIMPSDWLTKMLNYEVTPPEQAWDNITLRLDKEDNNSTEALKLKMLTHEEIPPVAVFDKIFSKLDAQHTLLEPVYVEKLKVFSETPPADAWKNIITKLDEDKIIPLDNNRKKIRPLYLKLAASAAIVAIIIIAVLPGKQTPADKGQIVLAPSKTEPAQVSPANVISDTQNNNRVKTNLANAVIKENTNAKNDFKTTNTNGYVKSNHATNLAQDPLLYNKEKLQNSNGETPMDIALVSPPNSYISITGADGQSVKVSSKFSNLISYLAGDNTGTKENIDVIIEESAKWRKIFSEWRNKMTNNVVAPTFSNFMDIIELSNVVEGKER